MSFMVEPDSTCHMVVWSVYPVSAWIVLEHDKQWKQIDYVSQTAGFPRGQGLGERRGVSAQNFRRVQAYVE